MFEEGSRSSLTKTTLIIALTAVVIGLFALGWQIKTSSQVKSDNKTLNLVEEKSSGESPFGTLRVKKLFADEIEISQSIQSQGLGAISGNLTVAGTTILQSTAEARNDVLIGGALNVLGNSKLKNITARFGNFSDGLSVGGSLYLPSSSIVEDYINSGAISTAKLQDAAVTTSKLADESVSASKIASGSITDLLIASNAAISGIKITPNFGDQNIYTAGYLTLGGGSLRWNSTANSFEFSSDLVNWRDITSLTPGTCPANWVRVPGNASLGTKDFCTMKYTAKNDGTTTPVSAPSGTEWATSPAMADQLCKRTGSNGHLMTIAERTTINRNIEATAINDIDSAAGVQLATGHSDNGPVAVLATVTEAEPSLENCNLSVSLSDASNANCQLRGNGNSYAGNYTDRGYYGTGNYYSESYTAGSSGKSQFRTYVLSNGGIIWDLAGNIYEMTSDMVGAPITKSMSTFEWTNPTVAFDKKYFGPLLDLTSVNGAGTYKGFTYYGNFAEWNGYYGSGASAGIYRINGNASGRWDNYTWMRFRCVVGLQNNW